MAHYRGTPPVHTDDQIDAFFSHYPDFTYQRDQPIYSELHHMYDTFNWRRENPEREEAWKKFRVAVIETFNSIFGSDAEDLASWQRICRSLGITPIPQGLSEARKAVVQTHVNLVDLLESVRNGSPVETFSTLEELRKYTVNEGRYFPKEEAYEGGLLRYLLREILNDQTVFSVFIAASDHEANDYQK
ncbi:hypothetical protein BDW59DRAFT_159939 [Aspergillus cavernicola]|uniref:Isoprenoid synthase domain-containing protein n=1 Tax=Aspergillus cavernicola TaxID=176166 RepID=A0ABR4IJR3_9EURO